MWLFEINTMHFEDLGLTFMQTKSNNKHCYHEHPAGVLFDPTMPLFPNVLIFIYCSKWNILVFRLRIV